VENEGRSLTKLLRNVWLSAGLFFVTFVLALAGVLKLPDTITEVVQEILLQPSLVKTGVWIAGLFAVVLLFSGVTIVVLWNAEERIAKAERDRDERLAKTEREHKERFAKVEREKEALEQDLRHTQRTLAQIDHLMVTDPITGIPNFRSWQRHAAAWLQTDAAAKDTCLILIDLDKLGALNNISHTCANRVLELFATRTYYSMRRNEHAFKIPNKNAPREIENQMEMFRHYAGGDEFCFHMMDEVDGAIGFVSRLKDACTRYEAEIKATILKDYMTRDQVADYRLQFCAAIVPLKANVPPEDVMTTVLSLLTVAKNDPTSRLMVQFGATPARTLDQRKAEIDHRIEGTDNATLRESLEAESKKLGEIAAKFAR
jgi:GGDEF domain-containing protein